MSTPNQSDKRGPNIFALTLDIHCENEDFWFLLPPYTEDTYAWKDQLQINLLKKVQVQPILTVFMNSYLHSASYSTIRRIVCQ